MLYYSGVKRWTPFRGCAAPTNPSPKSPPPDKVPQTSLAKCTWRRVAVQAHDSRVCSHLDLFSSQIPQQDFKDLWPSRKCKEREKLLFIDELFSFKAVPRRFMWRYSNFVYCTWYSQNRSWRDVCCSFVLMQCKEKGIWKLRHAPNTIKAFHEHAECFMNQSRTG